MIYPVQSEGSGTAAQATQADPRSRNEIRETPEKPKGAEPEDVVAAIRGVGGKIQFGDSTAEFSYNAELNLVVVKVFSSGSEPREVVRQFPPEEYLTFAARYRELLGVLFDEQV